MPDTKYRPIPDLTQKQIERFWSCVWIREPDQCWPWTASTDKDDYGTVGFNYKTYRAHRVAYKLHTGKELDGHGMHSCDHPWCVNPHHQSPGTDKDNQAFRKTDPRYLGENQPRAKISNEEAEAIRVAYAAGTKGVDLAEQYGISGAAVSLIVRRKNHRISIGIDTPGFASHSGENHHRSKLNWEKVREIRAHSAAGRTNESIAIQYGVSGALISLVVNHKIWIEEGA